MWRSEEFRQGKGHLKKVDKGGKEEEVEEGKKEEEQVKQEEGGKDEKIKRK